MQFKPIICTMVLQDLLMRRVTKLYSLTAESLDSKNIHLKENFLENIKIKSNKKNLKLDGGF